MQIFHTNEERKVCHCVVLFTYCAAVCARIFVMAEEKIVAGSKCEGMTNSREEKVKFTFDEKEWMITVKLEGDPKKPAIITYHDIGLNADSCFYEFFLHADMVKIAGDFCVFHINAPFQEHGALELPRNFDFPNLDLLAEMIIPIMVYFRIQDFIGFGVGVGASILVRFALNHPQKVNLLILINFCAYGKAPFSNAAYYRLNSFLLSRQRKISNVVLDYLMHHHFGQNFRRLDPHLTDMYQTYFSQTLIAANLAAFMESYRKRSPISIERSGPTLECPVLQIVSSASANLTDTIELNSRLKPERSERLQLSDSSGMIMVEQTDKVVQAILLFLLGHGYVRHNPLHEVGDRREAVPSPKAKPSSADDTTFEATI